MPTSSTQTCSRNLLRRTGLFFAMSSLFIMTGCSDHAPNNVNVDTKTASTDSMTERATTTDELAILQRITLSHENGLAFQGAELIADPSVDREVSDTRSQALNSTLTRVIFPASEHSPMLSVTRKGHDDASWNLAEHENANLAMEVHNQGSVSAHLYIDLLQHDDVLQSHSVSIPAGYQGMIYFPLTGVEAQTDLGFWGDAPSWKVNNELRMSWRSWKTDEVSLDNVDEIRFFTIGNLRSKKLALGSLLVRENPPIDNDWLTHIVDKYGQSTRVKNPVTIASDQALSIQTKQELAVLDNANVPENRSQYGGWKAGPALKATGFFRTEKVNGQWWMVDPEGYLFFSHGPANVRMANTTTFTGVDYANSSIRDIDDSELTPEDSIDIVTINDDIKKTASIAYPQRRNMFAWLPDYDEPLAQHYSYRRTSHKGPIKHGETYSFYRANLQRKYGDDFLSRWEDITIKRMHDWGFTSFGNWVDPMFYDADRIPYFANGWIIGNYKTLSGEVNHWGEMPDPYDPEFAKRAKITIDQIAKEVNSSKWCAGIFIDNEKSWGEREGSVAARYGIVLDALSKHANDSPAKMAFVKRVEKKYADVALLNAAWGTHFTQWEDIRQSIAFNAYPKPLVDDLSMLLAQLGEQYFKVVHNTLEAALPNHLYMGARMANWGMPDEIIQASLKYSDALSFNIYEEGMQPHFWDFLEDIDLPVVIGEFHIGTATDSGLYNPGIVHASDQQDRARMYTEYMQSVLNKPYMVGAHWFQYIDEPITGRAHDGENANIGLVTIADVPYPPLIEAIKATTENLYEKRYMQTNDE